MIPETAAEDGITNIAANAVVDLGNASVFADGARTIASWVVSQKNWVQVTDINQLYATIDTMESQVAASTPGKTASTTPNSKLRHATGTQK